MTPGPIEAGKYLDMIKWLESPITFLLHFITYLKFRDLMKHMLVFLARLQNAISHTVTGEEAKRQLEKLLASFQFSSVAQSCPPLCDPMNCSMPGLPVHHQLPEFTQTHVHRISGVIQPSHPLLSLPPPAFRSLLVIYFIYNSMYMSISISQFTPPTLSSLVTTRLLPTSVTLFLFYK